MYYLYFSMSIFYILFNIPEKFSLKIIDLKLYLTQIDLRRSDYFKECISNIELSSDPSHHIDNCVLWISVIFGENKKAVTSHATASDDLF